MIDLTAKPAGAALLALAAGAAWGQPAPELAPPPDPSVVVDHPVLRLSNPESHRVTLRIQLLTDIEQNITRDAVRFDTWQVDSMSVVLPVITRTGTSVGVPANIKGGLWLDGVQVDSTPTIIGPYQGQAMYARYEATNVSLRGFRVEQVADIVSYESTYDEPLAMTLGWPEQWPPEADSTFQPQQLISEQRSALANEGPVNDLVRAWTEGQDPKAIPPAQLAKYLTAKVWEHVSVDRPSISNRPSDGGLILRYDGEAETLGGSNRVRSSAGRPIALDVGFNIQHVDETARTGRGSDHDACMLLTAVFRAAGLPARVVIGYRERSDTQQRLSTSKRYHPWVEFALYDPAAQGGKGQVIWIPVDLLELMGSSSRARPIDQTWNHFGTSDELDHAAPLATHFHPPTTVRSYAVPALYGWTTTPPPPDRASQGMYVNLSSTPIRASGGRSP